MGIIPTYFLSVPTVIVRANLCRKKPTHRPVQQVFPDENQLLNQLAIEA